MDHDAKKTDFGLGCGGTVVFLIFVGFGAFVALRSCDLPYRSAERLLPTDPCAAARAFSNVVRQDDRNWSRMAVNRLSTLDSSCALRELIGLMDLPDGIHVGYYDRQIIWNAVQKKASALNVSEELPRYSPNDGQLPREVEKKKWLEWLDKARLKG